MEIFKTIILFHESNAILFCSGTPHISGKWDMTGLHFILTMIFCKSPKSVCFQRGQSDDSSRYIVEISVPTPF